MKNIIKRIEVLLILLFIILALFNIHASGDDGNMFVGQTGSPNDTSLYNSTNTFYYNGSNSISDKGITIQNRTYTYYNVNSPTNIPVNSGAPQITVITHGLGGDASHWSNDGNDNFAYDSSSIISRIDNELYKSTGTGANIYWAKMQGNDSFKLYDLKNSSNISNNQYFPNVSISQITDISKHIILVFESTTTASSGYNYQVYEEFNYMLSKIVYDVKVLNGGYLPKINLIGHSRGGLTNLEYVLDHPMMIGSVFSLGTPYFGSDTASTSIGASLAGNSEGLTDVIDSDVYMHYYNRWDSNYNTLYDDIKYYAIGGYSTINFLFDEIINSLPQNDFEEYAGSINILRNLINVSPAITTILINIGALDTHIPDAFTFHGLDFTKQDLLAALEVILEDTYSNKSTFDSNNLLFINRFTSLMSSVSSSVYLNDVLVDLSSQVGVYEHSSNSETYDFEVFQKRFTSIDYENKAKKMSVNDQPAIVHNLEARDDDLINFILTKITLGINDVYVCEDFQNTTKIVGYRGNIQFSSLIIPSVINGKTVTKIGPNIFHGEGDLITSITIPDTVASIENDAFIGLINLEEVNINYYGNLLSIGDRAFAGCESLSKFGTVSDALKIPIQVNEIGDYAFYGTSFETIYINPFSFMIGECAFSEIDGLHEIDANSNGIDFYSINGVLFSGDDILLQYPTYKTSQAYSIPSTTVSIANCAFKNATNLTSVGLGNVQTIGDYAFYGCDSIYNVIIPSTVTEIGSGAFENCIDLAAISLSSNLNSIGSYAFKGCESLYAVEIPSSVLEIGDEAFYGCSDLVEISILRDVAPITRLGIGAFEYCSNNFEIVVPINRIADYKNKARWMIYKSIIVPSSTSYTSFILNNATDFNTTSIYIGSGLNKIYKLDVLKQNVYTITAPQNSNIVMRLYNSNMELMVSSDTSITKLLRNGNIYYLTIEHKSVQSSGNISVNIKKDNSHNHVYTYEWENNISHIKTCDCDYSAYEGHVVPSNSFANGEQFAICLKCGGIATVGAILDNIDNLLSTINGSYILPNGIIVLVEEDYEAYFNGTLEFGYHNDNLYE